MLRIGSIVLRVDDLRRQTEFWQAALGYVRRDDGTSDDFVLLGPPDGDGPNLSLDQVRSELQIPPRLHLDLYTENQAGEVERLLALGATEVHWTNDRRMQTTSSSPIPRGTASAWSIRRASDRSAGWATVRECHSNIRGTASYTSRPQTEKPTRCANAAISSSIFGASVATATNITITSGGRLASLVEQVGRAIEPVEILAPGGCKFGRHVELSSSSACSRSSAASCGRRSPTRV